MGVLGRSHALLNYSEGFLLSIYVAVGRTHAARYCTFSIGDFSSFFPASRSIFDFSFVENLSRVKRALGKYDAFTPVLILIMLGYPKVFFHRRMQVL